MRQSPTRGLAPVGAQHPPLGSVVLRSWAQRSNKHGGQSPTLQPDCWRSNPNSTIPSCMASEEVSDLCASVPSRAKGRNSTPTSEGSPGLRMGPAWRKHPTSPAATSVNPVSDSYAALHGYRRLSMRYLPGSSQPSWRQAGWVSVVSAGRTTPRKQ